jgi:AhpD family alkylhydroperoxidase
MNTPPTSQAGGYDTLTRSITRQLAPMRQGQPQVMEAFGNLSRSVMVDGALSEKTKELIALALGVAAHCDGCIGFHTKALARLGATPEEVREALSVAVYMGGGPSLMYSASAIGAFEEFCGKQRTAS